MNQIIEKSFRNNLFLVIVNNSKILQFDKKTKRIKYSVSKFTQQHVWCFKVIKHVITKN